MISFRKKYAQLDSLASAEEATLQNDDLKEFPVDLDLLDSRLGRAGILNRKAQRRYIYRWICSASFGFVAILLAGVSMEVSPMLLLASVFVLGYLFLLAFLLVLRSRSLRFERDILFALPMVVEQLLLLVNAGLGPIPAIAEILDRDNQTSVDPFLATVYQLSEQGSMFEEALAEVAASLPFVPLKHFFLHLETSISYGAELSTSLQQLSDYIHTEWTVTIEGVVRRLESAVVFPVFVSVIGLLLLVSAVPIVPLLELSDSLKGQQIENLKNGAVR